jgi:toxin ParE1/3/4
MQKKYNIQLLPSARNDLMEIAAYIAIDNYENALKYINKIELKIEKLTTYPKLGKIPKDKYLKNKNYRILVIDKYIVFYKIQSATVKIFRILHSARDLKKIFL